MSEPEQPNPWDRLPDEPSLWFDRFDTYRLLGPTRSVESAWREERKRTGNNAKSCPGSWTVKAKVWRWRERAEAWDTKERPNRQQQQLAELAATRARHREMSRTVQDLAMKAIELFKAGDLTPVEALKYLEMGADLERKAIEEPLIAEVVRIMEELKKSRKGKK